MRLIAKARANAADADPLESFGSEVAEPRPALFPLTWPWPTQRIVVAGAALLVIFVLGWLFQRRAAAPPAPVTLTIETIPAGAEVLVGGVTRGRAPLTLQVSPGGKPIEVVSGADRVPVHVTAAPGSIVTQQVVFSRSSPAPASTASILVATDPPGLKVFVDDVAQGVSPATIDGVRPGRHRVRVRSAAGVVTQKTINVQAGQTMSLVLGASSGAPAAAAGAGGWLSIASPIPVQLIERGQVIGTSAAARVMLPAGSHDLEVVNDELGFRTRRSVRVVAGAASTMRVDVPRAPLSINAIPWADVTVGSDHIGETPIGNYSVPIGRHEVIYRHPELGERRQMVVVGLKTPARVTMDFRGK